LQTLSIILVEEKKYYEFVEECEELKKHDLGVNLALKKRVEDIEEDLSILRDISLDERVSSWRS
jgi:hypothetical protein